MIDYNSQAAEFRTVPRAVPPLRVFTRPIGDTGYSFAHISGNCISLCYSNGDWSFHNNVTEAKALEWLAKKGFTEITYPK